MTIVNVGVSYRFAPVEVLEKPTVRAREFSTGPNGPVYLDALRQLFDLGAPVGDAQVNQLPELPARSC